MLNRIQIHLFAIFMKDFNLKDNLSDLWSKLIPSDAVEIYSQISEDEIGPEEWIDVEIEVTIVYNNKEFID